MEGVDGLWSTVFLSRPFLSGMIASSDGGDGDRNNDGDEVKRKASAPTVGPPGEIVPSMFGFGQSNSIITKILGGP